MAVIDKDLSLAEAVVPVRYPRRESVFRFIERVRELEPPPALGLLFGSLVQGTYTQHSDADVLVVFETDPPPDWMVVYCCGDGIVEPHVASWSQFEQRLLAGDTFFAEIVETGKPVLDRGDYGDRARAVLAAAKSRHGLVRTATGWSAHREWSAPSGDLDGACRVIDHQAVRSEERRAEQHIASRSSVDQNGLGTSQPVYLGIMAVEEHERAIGKRGRGEADLSQSKAPDQLSRQRQRAAEPGIHHTGHQTLAERAHDLQLHHRFTLGGDRAGETGRTVPSGAHR